MRPFGQSRGQPYNRLMYVLASRLADLGVISLQTGEVIATAEDLLVDRDELELVAFRCETTGRRPAPRVLLYRDLRQLAVDCLIVDSDDELSEANDIVRVQRLLEENFHPVGTAVVTDTGRRLGKVEDFTINTESGRTQKIYVRRSLWRSWIGSSLIIDRNQIIDVARDRIVVRDATVTATSLGPKPVPDNQA